MEEELPVTSYHLEWIKNREKFDRTINNAMVLIRQIRSVIKIDRLLVTGLSGIIPGSVLSYKTGIQLCIIRKPEEQCHGQEVENSLFRHKADNHYVFVDDFIATGNTLERVEVVATNLGINISAIILLRQESRLGIPSEIPTFVARRLKDWFYLQNTMALISLKEVKNGRT